MQPFDLKARIDYVQDTIVSDVIYADGEYSITLKALDSGTEIKTHQSPVDAVVLIVEGDIEFVVDCEKFNLSTGEMLVMKKNTPHSLSALSKAKMLLIKIQWLFFTYNQIYRLFFFVGNSLLLY